MNMFEDEKKILKHDSLESPPKEVLDSARGEMASHRAKSNKKRIWRNVLISFASLAVTALVLVMCMPYMMPANSSDPNYITIDEMTTENILSIEEYNTENGTNIHSFDTPTTATAYYYEGKIMIIEEKSKVGDVDVSALVLFAENTLSYNFEILDNFGNKGAFVPNATLIHIGGIHLQKTNVNDCTFLTFSVDDYSYILEIQGENADWEEIFLDFLN